VGGGAAARGAATGAAACTAAAAAAPRPAKGADHGIDNGMPPAGICQGKPAAAVAVGCIHEHIGNEGAACGIMGSCAAPRPVATEGQGATIEKGCGNLWMVISTVFSVSVSQIRRLLVPSTRRS